MLDKMTGGATTVIDAFELLPCQPSVEVTWTLLFFILGRAGDVLLKPYKKRWRQEFRGETDAGGPRNCPWLCRRKLLFGMRSA